MYSHPVLRGLLAVSAVSLLLPRPGQAQELQSYRSLNFPYHFIRHQHLLGRIDKIVKADKLGRRDATFRLVPGLAGRCHSFESVNYPGHFLRHQNFRLKLAKETPDRLFKEDATFCVVQGLGQFPRLLIRVYQHPQALHTALQLRTLAAQGRREPVVQEGRDIPQVPAPDDTRPSSAD